MKKKHREIFELLSSGDKMTGVISFYSGEKNWINRDNQKWGERKEKHTHTLSERKNNMQVALKRKGSTLFFIITMIIDF